MMVRGERGRICGLVAKLGKATAEDMLPHFPAKTEARIAKDLSAAASRKLLHKIGEKARYGQKPMSIYAHGPGPAQGPWLAIKEKTCGRCGSVFSGVCERCKLGKIEAAKFRLAKRIGGYSEDERAAYFERLRVNRAERYAKDPAAAYQAVLEWRRENPDKFKATKAAWIAANPDKNREMKAAWARRNPEAMLLKAHTRRSRIDSDRLSRGITEKLLRLQRGKCACCAKPLGKGFHIDHIEPLARGGRNIDGNVQLLRSGCNQKKHAKDPIDYMQSKGFLL